MHRLPGDAEPLARPRRPGVPDKTSTTARYLCSTTFSSRSMRERHTSSEATVSHIKRSRAARCAPGCENFLYVFKAAWRAARAADAAARRHSR